MSGTSVNRLNIIRWVLGGSIILSCLGYAISTFRYTDKIFTFLWSEHYLNWSESLAMRISEWGAICMLCAAIIGTTYRFRVAQVFVFLWLLLSVYCSTTVEIWHPNYIWGSSAIRTLSPLFYLILLSAARVPGQADIQLKILEWGMRISIALTFFFHGHECLAAKAQFLDYIQSVVRLFGMQGISSASALAILKMIGVLDILVALAMLVPLRLYLIASWMAFWGLATGFIRITFAGWESYPEFLLRIIHGTLPICLIILWLGQSATNSEFKESKIQ